MPLKVSFFHGLYDTDAKPRSYNTFKEFVDEQRSHTLFPEAIDSEKTPAHHTLFSPATFKNHKREKNNVETVSMFVMDLDGVSRDEFLGLLERLQGYEWWTYSTFSNNRKAVIGVNSKGVEIKALIQAQPPETRDDLQPLVSARIVVPLDRPATAKEWPTLWIGINVFVSGMLDPNTKDASRMYYLPAAASDTDVFSASSEGTPLCVDEFLEAGGRNLQVSSGYAIEKVAFDDTTINVTKADLKDLARKVRRTSRSSRSAALADALDAVAANRIYAEQGDRDTMLWLMVNIISEHFLRADVEEIIKLFIPSMQACADAYKDSTVDGDIIKMRDKIQRAQTGKRSELEKAVTGVEKLIKDTILEAFRAVGLQRDTPYRQEEIDHFIQAEGLSDIDQLKKRLVLQYENSYYVYFDGCYLSPVGPRAISNSAVRDLSPFHPYGVKLASDNEDANISPDRLVKLYGTVVRGCKGSLSAQRTRYDAKSQNIMEAVCPLRALEAEYSPLAEEFMKQLSGDQYEFLKEWVMTITDLTRAGAVMYLSGAGSSGKSMFGKALSKLWSSQGLPCDLVNAVDHFNEALQQCALVVGDEYIPKAWQGDTSKIREFQQSTVRTLNRKGLPKIPLEGAVRVLLCANNPNLLETRETLTASDISAIASRIIHIEVPETCAAWLAANNGVEVYHELVTRDGMAKHALWLKKNHAERHQALMLTRFAVTEQKNDLVQNMTVTSGLRSLMCHWVANFLRNRKVLEATKSKECFVKEGKVYLTPDSLYSNWTLYHPNQANNIPTMKNVAATLRELSAERVELDMGSGVSTYFVFRTEYLHVWLKHMAYWSEGAMLRELMRDTPHLTLVPPPLAVVDDMDTGVENGASVMSRVFQK